MHQGRTVRVPVHVLREFALVLRARRQFVAANARMPSMDELAQMVGKSGGDVAELFCVTERISSLDAPLSDGDDRALIEQLVMDSTAAPGVDEAAGRRIDVWIGQLPARQRLVLQRRYGLNDEGTQTLAEIAAELGLTRERVRQIQSEALVRLRALVDAENRHH